MELISLRTRNKFRETLVGSTLREIDMFFEGAGLSKRDDFDPPVGGARRSLVEQYYAGISFESPADIKKLLSVYDEIVHSLDRNGVSDAEKDDLLRSMKRDGYDFDGDTFAPIPGREQPLVETIRALAAASDLPALRVEIDRLTGAADEDPSLAVGTAKEMVETICKTILQDRGVVHHGEDLPQLVRNTAKELALVPESIPDHAKGSEIIRRMLSNLNQVSQGIAELRNLYGSGHGREGRFTGIQPRHAKLAVGAAATLGTFLMETHLERITLDNDSPPADPAVHRPDQAGSTGNQGA